MFHLPGPHRSRRSSPRDHPDKLDPVAVLERARGPLIPRQSLEIELNEQEAGIEAAVAGEFSQRRGRADLPGVAIDENAQASLHRFRHVRLTETALLGIEQVEVEDDPLLHFRGNIRQQVILHPGLAVRRKLRNTAAFQGEIPRRKLSGGMSLRL